MKYCQLLKQFILAVITWTVIHILLVMSSITSINNNDGSVIDSTGTVLMHQSQSNDVKSDHFKLLPKTLKQKISESEQERIKTIELANHNGSINRTAVPPNAVTLQAPERVKTIAEDPTIYKKWADEFALYQPPQYIEKLDSLCYNVDPAEKEIMHKSMPKPPPKKKTNTNSKQAPPTAVVEIKSTSLICLPSIYIIGVSKSGTTDLYAHLAQHQHIIVGQEKEPHFWETIRTFIDKNEYGKYVTNYNILSAIVEKCYLGYDPVFCQQKSVMTGGATDRRTVQLNILAEELKSYREQNRTCPLQTIDATTTYFSTAHTWQNEPLNKGLHLPRNLPQHRIKQFIRNSKLILFLRDPVERLISDFYYFVEGKTKQTPKYFHELVVNGIKWWKNCTDTLSEFRCAYGTDYKGTGLQDLGTGLFSWGDSAKLGNNGAARIRVSIYVIYIEKWLEVFDRNTELYIQTLEHFNKNSKSVLSQEILPFLKLEPFSNASLDKIDKMEKTGHKNTAKKNVKKEILPETRNILVDFYKPYNERLAKLLGDKKYLWLKQ